MIQSINQLQQKLQNDFSFTLPDVLINQITKLQIDSNISYDLIFTSIQSALNNFHYSWTAGMPGQETPLLYCREPNSFQSGDYTISKLEKYPDKYTATIYINSVQETILGHGTDIISLKSRVENYAKLSIVRQCLSDLNSCKI